MGGPPLPAPRRMQQQRRNFVEAPHVLRKTGLTAKTLLTFPVWSAQTLSLWGAAMSRHSNPYRTKSCAFSVPHSPLPAARRSRSSS